MQPPQNNNNIGLWLLSDIHTTPTTHYYNVHYWRTQHYRITFAPTYASTKDVSTTTCSRSPHNLHRNVQPQISPTTITTTINLQHHAPTTCSNGCQNGPTRKNSLTHSTSQLTTATTPPQHNNQHKHFSISGRPNSQQPRPDST